MLLIYLRLGGAKRWRRPGSFAALHIELLSFGCVEEVANFAGTRFPFPRRWSVLLRHHI